MLCTSEDIVLINIIDIFCIPILCKTMIEILGIIFINFIESIFIMYGVIFFIYSLSSIIFFVIIEYPFYL